MLMHTDDTTTRHPLLVGPLGERLPYDTVRALGSGPVHLEALRAAVAVRPFQLGEEPALAKAFGETLDPRPLVCAAVSECKLGRAYVLVAVRIALRDDRDDPLGCMTHARDALTRLSREPLADRSIDAIEAHEEEFRLLRARIRGLRNPLDVVDVLGWRLESWRAHRSHLFHEMGPFGTAYYEGTLLASVTIALHRTHLLFIEAALSASELRDDEPLPPEWPETELTALRRFLARVLRYGHFGRPPRPARGSHESAVTQTRTPLDMSDLPSSNQEHAPGQLLLFGPDTHHDPDAVEPAGPAPRDPGTPPVEPMTQPVFPWLGTQPVPVAPPNPRSMAEQWNDFERTLDRELGESSLVELGRDLALHALGLPCRRVQLLAGPMGAGKSHGITHIADVIERTLRLPFPVVTLDASQLRPAGWRGQNIADIARVLRPGAFMDASTNTPIAQPRGVIVLDEFDKLAPGSAVATHEDAPYRTMVLRQLQTLFSGLRLHLANGQGDADEVETASWAVVVAGVFETLGNVPDREGLERLGYPAELADRIGAWHHLPSPDASRIVAVLQRVAHSHREAALQSGFSLVVVPETLAMLARAAAAAGEGIRPAVHRLERAFRDATVASLRGTRTMSHITPDDVR